MFDLADIDGRNTRCRVSKHYYVWNIINPPNPPTFYKVRCPEVAARVIDSMAEKQLEDDTIVANAFGLLVGSGENLPHPSEDADGLIFEEWENRDGEDISDAAGSGVWEE